jgi:hypothetical protein
VKVESLCSVINTYAHGLNDSGAEAAAGLLHEFLQIFEGHGKRNVSDFLKLARSANVAETNTRLPQVGEVVPIVARLLDLVKLVGKKNLVDDLAGLLDLLAQFRNVSLSGLSSAVASASKPNPKKGAAPVNHSIIESYLHRLEVALGNEEAFMALYAQLKNDKEVAQREMAVLADRFMGPVAPSTSKKKSLERILYRHRKLMNFTPGGRAA